MKHDLFEFNTEGMTLADKAWRGLFFVVIIAEVIFGFRSGEGRGGGRGGISGGARCLNKKKN